MKVKTLYTSTQYGYEVQADVSSASAEVLDALWAWGASQFAAHVANTYWRNGSKYAIAKYDLVQWLEERGTGQNRTALSAPAADILLAADSGADALILDLEDSIIPTKKAEARAAIAAAVPRVAQNGADVVVRINRPLELAVPDIEAAVMPGVSALMMPG